MALTWDKRLPFVDTAGRKRIVERAMACAGLIAEQIGVPEAAVHNARLLGCGNYGCTLLIEGLPRDRAVIKVTSDNLEANAAKQISEDGTRRHEPGLVQIHKVFRLGKCSVMPGMRPFVFKHAATGQTVTYRGGGTPYRPLWVIQREEIDDAWPRLKALGVKQAAATEALGVIWRYATDLAAFQTSFGRFRHHSIARPASEDVDRAMALVHGHALVNAIDWLVERDMSWLDMRKIINLGWREGRTREDTGLVIRDIGATESGAEVLEEIDVVGGARGQTRSPSRRRR